MNTVASKATEAVLWSDWKSTVKAMVTLEVVRWLAPWISISFVLFVGGNSLFVGPYALEKEVFRTWEYQLVSPYITQAQALKEKILKNVPKYTDVYKDE